MKIREIINEVKIDNIKGAGAVPLNADVDYFGVAVFMRPSIFLSLAAPLNEPHSKDGLKKFLQDGGAIGAPFLDIKVPPDWDDGDFNESAKISGHEGRNRMLAIRELEGDAPVETHLFFKQYRARDITPEMIANAKSGMIAEQSTRFVAGPLFEVPQ